MEAPHDAVKQCPQTRPTTKPSWTLSRRGLTWPAAMGTPLASKRSIGKRLLWTASGLLESMMYA